MVGAVDVGVGEVTLSTKAIYKKVTLLYHSTYVTK